MTTPARILIVDDDETVLQTFAKALSLEGYDVCTAASPLVFKDRVYVFNRGEHPMMVFDRDGKFLRSWGEGVFNRAHGLHIGPDESLYCTDDGDHSERPENPWVRRE